MSASTPYTLVTGASSGIGLELARLFAKEGRSLVLTARRKDRLEALAHDLRQDNRISVETIALDMEELEAPQYLFSLLEGKGIGVDILINNAGFGKIGLFKDQPLGDLTNMINLNISTLTQLSHLALPQMLERRSGGILNVASMAAFFPGPGFAVYYATKAYVLSLSEALHEEYKKHGITISALCPGPVETEFWDRAGEKPSMMQKLSKPLSAGQVAQAGYEGFKRKQAVIIPGVNNRISIAASDLLPRFLKRRIMALMQMPS